MALGLYFKGLVSSLTSNLANPHKMTSPMYDSPEPFSVLPFHTSILKYLRINERMESIDLISLFKPPECFFNQIDARTIMYNKHQTSIFFPHHGCMSQGGGNIDVRQYEGEHIHLYMMISISCMVPHLSSPLASSCFVLIYIASVHVNRTNCLDRAWTTDR